MKTVYQLQSGAWQARVTPAIGAQILSLTCRGRDVYLPLLSEEQLEENRFLHGSPILLPANRTVDGCFSFEGKHYTLPINEGFNHCNLHGELYLHAFSVTEVREDAISLVYENHGESYPFPFRLALTYQAHPEGFHQRYTLTNTGKGNMPYTFALHTTFAEPVGFSVPIGAVTPRNEETYLPIGENIPLNERQRSFRDGYRMNGERITGYYTSVGRTATVGDFRYTVSELFDHWVLYGDGSDRFVCIEPQCGAVNGLNLPGKHRILGEGQSEILETEITLKRS